MADGGGGMGCGQRAVPSAKVRWELEKALSIEKPTLVAKCLLAGYRSWQVKGFRGEDSTFTTIHPDMDDPDQIIDSSGDHHFAELVGRVAAIGDGKFEGSRVMVEDREKVIRYRRIRVAAVVAEMKNGGVEITEANALHIAAILCAAVPTDPAFLVPYEEYAYEEGIYVFRHPLQADEGVEPSSRPSGGSWVGKTADSKFWPEWKTLHNQTVMTRAVADRASSLFGSDWPLYSGDDFGDAEHHWHAIRSWMGMRPNALFTPPELVVDAMLMTEGRNREEIIRIAGGTRLSAVQSVRKLSSASQPGMRGYLHAMGHMSGLVTNIADLVNWERYHVLRIPPKNPDSAADVEIGVNDCWAYFDLVANWKGKASTRCGVSSEECRLLHRLPPTSAWECGRH